MYLLDPSGRYLTSAIDAAPTADAQQPIGRVYPLVPSDLPRKFSDQYAPLAVTGYAAAAGAPLDGTLVRLPLRSHALAAGSRFSHKFWSAARMRTLLGALEKQATPALLGLETLETNRVLRVSTRRRRAGIDAPPQTTIPGHDAPPRGALARDGGWRRTTISSSLARALPSGRRATSSTSLPSPASSAFPPPPSQSLRRLHRPSRAMRRRRKRTRRWWRWRWGPPTDGAPTVDGAVVDGAAEEVEHGGARPPPSRCRRRRRLIVVGAGGGGGGGGRCGSGCSRRRRRRRRWWWATRSFVLSVGSSPSHSRRAAAARSRSSLGWPPSMSCRTRRSRRGCCSTASRPSKARSAAASSRRISLAGRSGLPVHLLGHFALSGAEREVPISAPSSGHAAEAMRAEWNAELVKSCAAAAYAALLTALPKTFGLPHDQTVLASRSTGTGRAPRRCPTTPGSGAAAATVHASRGEGTLPRRAARAR